MPVVIAIVTKRTGRGIATLRPFHGSSSAMLKKVVPFSTCQNGGRGENEGEDAVETVQEGSMPPFIYTIMRPSRRLSAAEKQELIRGLAATFGAEGEGEGEHEEGKKEKKKEKRDMKNMKAREITTKPIVFEQPSGLTRACT